MITSDVGVKAMKKIAVKRFNSAVAHNLRLVAVSRDMPLYMLHDQIVKGYINQNSTGKVSCYKIPKNDTYSYNIFIAPDTYKSVLALAEKSGRSVTDILLSALMRYARKHKLTISYKNESSTDS